MCLNPTSSNTHTHTNSKHTHTHTVFSIIMLTAYTANLTANLTVSRLESTIRTLADLRRSGRMFGVPADSSVLRYFKDSKVSL